MGKLHRKPQNSLNQETRDKIYSAVNPKQDYTPLIKFTFSNKQRAQQHQQPR